MILSDKPADIDEAVKLARTASSLIKQEIGVNDFFFQKAVVVESELLTKINGPANIKVACETLRAAYQ